ncbi:mitochondrial import inner membrane translocase subunit Tim21-like [Patiria miniata]|uniref:Mitochondrial import inner membrane translocase subunit Tim21 n=1 Tax=Patiria miniata TaxID=46514 RepID=A0A914B3U6_PATMI|nr:mitochondrial import inner membrane translocase subunit Tim21-like [Patiria miniata]XP_038070172.1 mitochondrial import inner membrane translocase subunit Tim21-like [Patiria miniata]
MSSLLRPSSWMAHASVYHQLIATKNLLFGRCTLLANSHVTCSASAIGLAATIGKETTGGQFFILKRFMATKKQTLRKDTKQVAQRAPGTGQGEVAIGQRVVQAGKDVSYMGVVIVGIGVTAIMFYAIGRELFASSSPNAVYTKAYKLCNKDSEIIKELGEPIKGFGETTRRGRRRHVSHLEYEQDGVKHMRMKFYIQGPKRKGTVHLEVKEGETGKYEYRYLFVELNGYPHRTIVLEDNR